MLLKGKTALIAGAGRNNGRAIALAYAREGADLILVSRERREELDQTARECASHGVRTQTLLADLSKHEEANRAARLGMEHFGKVDVLVSVAGARPQKLPWEYSFEEWLEVFAINCHSTFSLAKALVPAMIERGQGGSIIALGGGVALTAWNAHGAAVVASKHALYGLIKSLAKALGPHNIRANLIALMSIENERQNPQWYRETGGDPNKASQKLATTPLGRLGRPEEVANVALFLASDQSSYVTGDRICCAGGSIM
jgi:NAD(P)-dependent dehydrogenase (short-subunit alcohol dehydrogenase family)